MQKSELSNYLQSVSLFLLGILFLAFPLLYTTLSTDPFGLPKQALLGAVVLALLVFLGITMINEGKVSIRLSPFDLPLSLLLVFALASSILSINRYESLIAFGPLLFAVGLYFVAVNTVKTARGLLFVLSSLLAGASILSLNAILSFFKVYLLPYSYTHTQTFTPIGGLLDQAIYLALVLPIALYFAAPILKANDVKELTGKTLAYLGTSVIILLGLSITIYSLIAIQKPTILPFETGFQTAFAEISQDTGRVVQGFLVGSGFGTYSTDFTRFKQATYNAHPTLWSFTFFRSSSFVLELLATVGVLGVAAFVFLLIRVLRGSGAGISTNPFFASLLLAAVASFVLPFSFVTYSLFFFLLSLFTISQALKDPRRFFTAKLHFVAFKEGLVSLDPVTGHSSFAYETLGVKFLPGLFTLLFVAVAAVVGFFATRLIYADFTMQESFVAAAANNGGKTYDLQNKALSSFPYKDSYQRVFSQTNLALANSLAASTPQGASPSAQTQQTILTLIQQSINTARNATTLAPLNVANWDNLSSIYRSMIGFGENADSFSLATAQQAVALDPNNPQERVNLGGLYYQLNQWDNAQREFQVAISLKPDFANAYYNLGHTLEQKGDLQNALLAYQTVRTLVQNEKQTLEQINKEIEALQTKVPSAEQNTTQTSTSPSQQSALQIPTPAAQLPQQKTPVSIPAPATSSAR